MRLDVRRIGPLKVGDEVVGAKTRVKVVKNKCAPPFREAEFDIRWGTGIDLAGDLLDFAVAHGIVEKSGAYLSFRGETLGQGREKSREAIKGPIGATIRSAVETALGQRTAAQ